jgi:hypothetical protein
MIPINKEKIKFSTKFFNMVKIVSKLIPSDCYDPKISNTDLNKIIATASLTIP